MGFKKNNYIIIGYNSDLYKYSYDDVMNMENVRYSPSRITTNRPLLCLVTDINKCLYVLYRLHHLRRVNSIINIPFKKIWFNFYYKEDFQEKKPLIFLFFSRNIFLEKYGFINFLKKKYSGSKFVCFFQDLVNTHRDISINDIKNLFDLVITFDNQEASLYGFEHFPLVASKCNYDLSSNINDSDVYFLGVAKDRLNDIITAYEKLRKSGLVCDFHIAGVAKEKQIYSDEIKYIHSMSYIDNLRHINKTKCLLELMQKNGSGYTQRMIEAIVYDKKIITNNPTVKLAPFYNKKNILHVKNLNSITNDREFYTDFSRKSDYAYKDKVSPVNLLEFISDKLEMLKEITQ